METKNTVLVLVIILVASVLLTWICLTLFHPSETIEVPMYLEVSGHTAFNLDTSALYFGTTLPGGEASRGIIITNDSPARKKVSLSFSGHPLGKWARAEETNFIIQPYETRNILVTVSVPDDTAFGNYTDTIKVTLWRF